jgi:hypothetical protein
MLTQGIGGGLGIALHLCGTRIPIGFNRAGHGSIFEQLPRLSD